MSATQNRPSRGIPTKTFLVPTSDGDVEQAAASATQAERLVKQSGKTVTGKPVVKADAPAPEADAPEQQPQAQLTVETPDAPNVDAPEADAEEEDGEPEPDAPAEGESPDDDVEDEPTGDLGEIVIADEIPKMTRKASDKPSVWVERLQVVIANPGKSVRIYSAPSKATVSTQAVNLRKALRDGKYPQLAKHEFTIVTRGLDIWAQVKKAA